MHYFINSPLQIGTLTIPHRLIQGPLAGYSCAPFRVLFNQYQAPAYCVSEMSSAADILNKHAPHSRYIYRAADEVLLAYQLSGTQPEILAQAAHKLQAQGAHLIDLNCGCPKPKIRKKGAGSALLENPEQLVHIVHAIRTAISIPFTVKIRLQGNDADLHIAQQIAAAGADALIIHGRRWQDDYDVSADMQQIKQIKNVVAIPVIANGDIADQQSLQQAVTISGCDAYMIARAGCGRPWLYQELLTGQQQKVSSYEKISLFMNHLYGLADLEDEFKAVLQSKSLVRYYFGKQLDAIWLHQFYQLTDLKNMATFLLQTLS